MINPFSRIEVHESMISVMFTCAEPPFYRLLDILFREAKDVDIQSRLVTELRLRARQRQRYTSMQGRMFAAWDMYRAGDLSATGLLKMASTIYQPRLMRTLSETAD